MWGIEHSNDLVLLILDHGDELKRMALVISRSISEDVKEPHLTHISRN
jgi:hypothetical protein